MKGSFAFFIHWLWAIVFGVLAISGFAMIGAKYGWIVNYSLAAADYVHRVSASFFVILTVLAIGNEVWRAWKNEVKALPWMIIGPSGYQLFNFITALILILTGMLIWVCSDFNRAQIAFSLYVHEFIAYVVLVGVIWHIYQKCHALNSRRQKPKV